MKRGGLERKTQVGVASSAAGRAGGNLKCVCSRHAWPDATHISNPIRVEIGL